MLYNIVVAANTEAAIAAVRAAVPDTFTNDPRLNVDQTMGLWSFAAEELTDANRAAILAAGAQIINYDLDAPVNWRLLVVPIWVDPPVEE